MFADKLKRNEIGTYVYIAATLYDHSFHEIDIQFIMHIFNIFFKLF